jgi:hypothetical protein
MYTRPVKNNFVSKPHLSRGRRLFIAIVCLGFTHWIYLTWDNAWREHSYRVLTERSVEFEWARDRGFTRFDVKAYPGDWFGSRTLRAILATQLRPRVAAYLKPATWKVINGSTTFNMFSFSPLVLSTELGMDSSRFQDPTKTPLMHSAEFADLESMKKLIRSGADANAEDQNGSTALGYVLRSSGYRAQEAARLLLGAGADANKAEKNGNTVLMKAAQSGQIEIVRILLTAGADPNSKNQSGETAAVIAINNGYPGIAELIERSKNGPRGPTQDK